MKLLIFIILSLSIFIIKDELTSGFVSNVFAETVNLDLILRPKENDTYIKNEATATVIGAKSGTTSTSADTGSGLPGQPLPSNNPSHVKQVLCQQYRVCPTESRNAPPNQPWTLPELTALWNVAQRIAASPVYKNIVVGTSGPSIEVQRISHCPDCASWVQGYQAGIGTAGSTIPGSGLIYITNNANQGFSNAYLEWLYAHEIGHIAQHPPANALGAVNACGETVSAYGRNSRTENFADSVSFYMTNGEKAQEYLGQSGNLKNDFPCTYNALRNSAFGGVEF